MIVQVYVPAIEHMLTVRRMSEEELLAQCMEVSATELARMRAGAPRSLARIEAVEDMAKVFGVRSEVLTDQGSFETYVAAQEVLREEGQPDDPDFLDLVFSHRYAARQSTYEQSEYSVPRSKQEIRELYYAYRGW